MGDGGGALQVLGHPLCPCVIEGQAQQARVGAHQGDGILEGQGGWLVHRRTSR